MLKKVILPTFIFVLTCVVTLTMLQKHGHKNKEEAATSGERKVSRLQQTTIEGVSGVVPGQMIPLPELPSLSGGSVALGRSDKKHLIFGFISSSCQGCVEDLEFWKDLNDEATRRGVQFYLINVASEVRDRSDIEKFAGALGIERLPILYDPLDQALRSFNVGAAPQYVLLTAEGRVIARWDGVRRYDKQHHPEKLEEFFDHIQS